jgi:hypothetical protein
MFVQQSAGVKNAGFLFIGNIQKRTCINIAQRVPTCAVKDTAGGIWVPSQWSLFSQDMLSGVTEKVS